MIRMLIIGYCLDIRSERRLCDEVHLNLAYRWFCRLGLDGWVPDHSPFSMNRHGRFRDSDLLRRLFETVLARCIAEGLVGGEGFAVDGSLIRADANRQNVWPTPSANGSGSAGLNSLHKRIRPSGVPLAEMEIRACLLPEHRATGRPSSSHRAQTSQGRRVARAELGSGSHGRRPVDASVAQQRPGDARHLGRQGHYRRVGMRPRQQPA